MPCRNWRLNTIVEFIFTLAYFLVVMEEID